jgi:hypothetical protein
MRLEIFLYFCSDNFSQMSVTQLEKPDLLMKEITLSEMGRVEDYL